MSAAVSQPGTQPDARPDGKSDEDVEVLVRRKHAELDQIDHGRALLMVPRLIDAYEFVAGEMALIHDDALCAVLDEALDLLAERIIRLEERGARCKSRTDQIRRALLLGDEPDEGSAA